MEYLACTVAECDRLGTIQGLCPMHYARWWRHGDPTITRRGERRRIAPFHRRPPTSLDTPCREWWGQHDRDGYGLIDRPRPVGSVRVHRWVWEQVHGPIPTGVLILHRCDNPPCFRYDHLFIGTAVDNAADMMRKGRGRGQFTDGYDERRAL
jgi:hypothetical protein